MKTILVDAINAFVLKEDKSIYKPLHDLLENYMNPKIILTWANDEQMAFFWLDTMPYQLFTLKHDPEKTDQSYYQIMLREFNLFPDDVVYFEHDLEAVESARSIGIKTYHYDKDEKDLVALEKFLTDNL